MKRMRVMGLALGLGVALWAQTAVAPVAITAEPYHHLVIENATVRVFKVEVPAGKATLLHQHDYDYIFVTLGDAEVQSQRAGETKALQLKLPDGETRFTAGGFAHVARNLATTPFRNVTIEIRKEKPDADPETPITVLGAGAGMTEMLNNDRARAVLYEIYPGGVLPQHAHTRPHLVVALDDMELESDVAGKGKSAIRQKAGDVVWVEGGITHALRNLGEEPARFVSIDIK